MSKDEIYDRGFSAGFAAGKVVLDQEDRRLEAENEALRKSVEELRERWGKLKDVFQVTIDNYEDDESIDLSFARGVLDEMGRLEGYSTFDSSN